MKCVNRADMRYRGVGFGSVSTCSFVVRFDAVVVLLDVVMVIGCMSALG